MIKIDVGELRQSVSFQTNNPTRGTDGAEVDEYTDTVTTRAKIETTGGKEFYSAQRINAETTALFIVRYRSTINQAQRIKFGTRYFEIIAINNHESRNVWLLISAKEVI